MENSKVKRFVKAALAGALAVGVLAACEGKAVTAEKHACKANGNCKADMGCKAHGTCSSKPTCAEKAESKKDKAGCNQAAGKPTDKMACGAKMGCAMPK